MRVAQERLADDPFEGFFNDPPADDEANRGQLAPGKTPPRDPFEEDLPLEPFEQPAAESPETTWADPAAEPIDATLPTPAEPRRVDDQWADEAPLETWPVDRPDADSGPADSSGVQPWQDEPEFPAVEPTAPTEVEPSAREPSRVDSDSLELTPEEAAPMELAPLELIPTEQSLTEAEMAPPNPESEPIESPLDRELQEAQDAVERELQKRQSEEGVDDPLPGENPFGGVPEGGLTDDEQAALDKLLEQLQRGDEPDIRNMQPGPLTPQDVERLRRVEERRRQQLAEERVEVEENCREEFEKLRLDRIDTIDLSIEVQGQPGQDYPFECGLGDERFSPRQWPEITYMWKASGLCHKPLYFEQVQVERYGHSWGPYLQPIMSGAHFFVSVPILPYKMGIRTPNECVYTLGYYRPGSCAPYMIDPVPFTWRAALFQGAASTGAAFVLP